MAKAVTVYQYEQPRCPDGWSESERRFYARLIEALDGVYSKFGRIDEKMLSERVVDKVNGAPDAALEKLQGVYSSATVDNLVVNALTAETARIVSLVVEKMVADTIVANQITAGSIEASFAYMVSLSAKFGSFDFGTVQNLVSNAMVLEKGTADTVYIKNLSVLYAQILNATIGALCIKASDGNYYQIDVSQGENGQPNVSAVKVEVGEGEIASGVTDGGKVILGTNILAENLNTGTLYATEGLVNSILAEKIDVGTLTAREAFIEKLVSSDAFINKLTSREIFGDKSLSILADDVTELGGRMSAAESSIVLNGDAIQSKVSQTDFNALTGRVETAETKILQTADDITFVAGNVKKASRNFRQESAPTGADGVKYGDFWVVPSTGQTWQATDASDLNLKFAIDESGTLAYQVDGDPTAYKLWIEGNVLMSEGFAFPLGADGSVGAAYTWTLVQDSELVGRVDNANDRIDGLDDSMGAQMARIEADYLSRPDFERLVRVEKAGMYVGDNLSPEQLLLGSGYINFLVDGVLYSRIGKREVQFGNYIVGLAPDGGLVLRPAGG